VRVAAGKPDETKYGNQDKTVSRKAASTSSKPIAPLRASARMRLGQARRAQGDGRCPSVEVQASFKRSSPTGRKRPELGNTGHLLEEAARLPVSNSRRVCGAQKEPSFLPKFRYIGKGALIGLMGRAIVDRKKRNNGIDVQDGRACCTP